MKTFIKLALFLLVACSAMAQRRPTVVDSFDNLVTIIPSPSQPDVIVVQTNSNTRLQFRYYPTATDSTNTISPYVFATSTGTGRWKEVLLLGTIRVPTFDAVISDVTSPVSFQFFQRTNDVGQITVSGVAAGLTGTSVEARFDGGAWATVDTTDDYGNFSGTLSAATGQGSVDVRVVGSSTTITVTNVSVGDIFAIWGQSNGSGRGLSNQSFTNTTTLASMYGNDGEWKLLADPTDDNTGQLDAISSDADAAGSVWPLVADQIIATTGVPVAFVQCTKGATGFATTNATSWSPWSTQDDRNTLFGSGTYRIRQVGGVRAILWWQGEGGFDDTTGQSYNVPFSEMASAVASEFPGLKIIPAKIQECPGVLDSRMTNGWYAIGLLWATNSNVLNGPILADAPVGAPDNIVADDEGSSPDYHLIQNATLAEAARRWATNIIAHFP